MTPTRKPWHLAAVLVSGPTNGLLTLNADGSFTYTPKANYFGADSFTYQATDGLFASNISTVSLTVNALPPMAANDSFSTNVNTPLNVTGSGVLANDSDPQTLPLSAVLVSGPTNGSLTLNANGSFSYAPNANYFGSDNFTYQANDGLANSTAATVSLTINALPPVATNDSFNTSFNTPLNVAASGVLGNDTDPQALALTRRACQWANQRLPDPECQWFLQLHAERQLLRFRQFHLPGDRREVPLECCHGVTDCQWAAPCGDQRQLQHQRQCAAQHCCLGVLANDSDPQALALSAILVSGPTNGSLILNTNGSFSYTPNANYFGADSFTYQANDGLANSNVAIVSLTVNALPPVATNDSFSTTVNTPLNVAASGVLGNDSDPQALALSAIPVSGPTNGSLTLNANGSFSYTPNANYFGSDSFTYQANDGLANSTVATVSLTIKCAAAGGRQRQFQH